MFLKTSKISIMQFLITPNLWQQHFKMFEIMKSCIKEKASSSLSSLIGYEKVNTHLVTLQI